MLAEDGMDIHVFTGTANSTRKSNENGYVVHRINCNNGYDFKEKIVPLFSSEEAALKFDVVESPEINSAALLLKQKFPTLPLLVRMHAPDHLVESFKKKYYPITVKARYFAGALKRGKWDPGYWKKYDYKNDPDYQFCKLADQITAPSKAMKEWTVKNWHIAEEKITVLPNPFIVPSWLLSLPIHHTPNNEILFFGRLNVLKGLVNASHAMKQVLKNNPRYNFKVVGDDGPGPTPGSSMKRWMQQEFSEFKRRIFFLEGFTYDKLAEVIATADIVLLPSLFESFSYTCAEAMAAGKAVIGSKETGMEFMEHGQTGLLIDPGNKKEIQQAVQDLIDDNDKRVRLAGNARNAISNLFNGAGLLAAYKKVYKNMRAVNV